MQLHFTWINLLILFGAIQGLTFCITLLFNRKHPGARFLSILMLALAYNGFETFNWSSGLENYFIGLSLFPFILIYTVGPALYLYVSSLLFLEREFSQKEILRHFYIVFFQFTFRSLEIVYFILWNSGTLKFESFPPQMMDTIYWTYSEPLSVIVFITYLVFTIKLYRKSNTTGISRSFSKESQQLVVTWVKALLICMIILAVFWPLTLVFSYINNFSSEWYYPIELALVLFIYWIAFAGYHRTKAIYLKNMSTVSLMTPEDQQQKMDLLRKLMEREKLYLDPELSLSKLSDHAGLPLKTVSLLLNMNGKSGFNDFVNYYRVEDVKGRLLDPQYSNFTISAIALESGFNSQATFQRVFKASTGQNPKEYIALQLTKTGS